MAISEGLGRRRNLLLVASVLLLVPGLGLGFQQETKAAAEKISAALEKQGRKSVAVVDFTDLQGSVTELGRFMAEQLSVTLASEDRSFKVIDRGHLRKILREQGLGSSGVIDPTTAQEVGRIAGVDTLITGTLTPFGETVSLSLKALDTRSAENIRAMSVEIPKTNAIAELLGRGLGATEASAPPKLGSRPRPPERKSEATPTRKATSNGYAIELQSCLRRHDDKVVCDVGITNHEPEDRILSLNSQSYSGTSECVDSAGRTVAASQVSSGSKVSRDSIRMRLYSGIPVLATLEFKGIDPTEGLLKAVAISGQTLTPLSIPVDNVRVTLRDIPIAVAGSSGR